MNLTVHLEGVDRPDSLRRACSEKAEELHEEFPEITRVDVTVHKHGAGHETHVHVNGKDLEVVSRARNADLALSVGDAFEKTRRQLRKRHDKQIFSRRREAQRPSGR